MPRADKQATKREEVSLAEQRPVQLQSSKRFFSGQGSDRATRQARALTQAFQVGTEFVSEEIDRRNIKGGQRALGAAAGGEGRDPEDKNFGYNKAWDELDAERDINFMKKELPEILRGADWENLGEAEVQGLISEYMKDQQGGVDPTGFYGQKLIPAMLAMEAEVLSTHRDMIVQRIQSEQRTTIQENLTARFESSKLNPETPEGAFDFAYAGEQTNIFFDGADKRVAYIESITEFAVNNGRPDIIDNIPHRFGPDAKGDPTGAGDPVLREKYGLNAARAQAQAVADSIDRKEAAALKAHKAEVRNTANRQLALMSIEGVDPTAKAAEYLQLGIIEGSDATTFTSSARATDAALDKADFDAVWNATMMANTSLGDPSVTEMFLYEGWRDGKFGPPLSDIAKTRYRQSLQDLKDAQAANQRVASNPAMKTWSDQFSQGHGLPKTEFGVIQASTQQKQLWAAHNNGLKRDLIKASPASYQEVFENWTQSYISSKKLLDARESSRSPKALIRNLEQENFTMEEAKLHMQANGWTVGMLLAADEEERIENRELYADLLDALNE